MRRWLTMATMAVALAACGDATGPAPAYVDGSWRFAWSMSGTMSGVTLDCTIADADFDITQSGSTFTGVQVGTATMTCTAPGYSATESIYGETIESGRVYGSDVTFTLGSIPGEHSGSVDGSTLSGTAEWNLPVSGGMVTMTGDFSAYQY